MIKPRKISGKFKDRKKAPEGDDIFNENIKLEMFPNPIPEEFLTEITPEMWKHFKKSKNHCVVYYSSPPNETLMSGYYELVSVGKRPVLMTSVHGEYSVPREDCFLTQELVYAYSRGIKLIFESVSLEDSSTVIKELQAERWDEMAINSYELE